MKKIIAGLIAGIMVFSMCSCKKNEEKQNLGSKAYETKDSNGNVIDLELEYQNKKLKDGVIAVVGDLEITKEQVRFMLAQTNANYVLQNNLEQAENAERDTSFDAETEGTTMTYREQLYSYAISNLVSLGVFANKGVDKGISFTDEEIKAKCDELGITKEYDILKNQYGLTDEGVNDVWRLQFVSEQYSQEHFQNDERLSPTKETLEKYFDESFIKAKHILKLTQDQATGAALDEEGKKAVKKEAEDILAQLKAGADFDTLMAAQSEDPGSEAQPEGYVFTEGEMVTEFYEGAKALKPGELSDIIETSYGYHIIKRVDLTDADFEANNDKITSAYRNTESQKIFNEALESAKVYIDYEQLLKVDDILYKKTTLMEELQKLQESETAQ